VIRSDLIRSHPVTIPPISVSNNENDIRSRQEIRFGDNDTLSAISSAIVHADYLFLLTDVECLYTDNPRNNPDAKPVRVVRDIEKVKRQGECSVASSIPTYIPYHTTR
jgi:glutamate 5-kinase